MSENEEPGLEIQLEVVGDPSPSSTGETCDPAYPEARSFQLPRSQTHFLLTARAGDHVLGICRAESATVSPRWLAPLRAP